MKNNETGEFELVLGNRQLLSGFAIVVILFGVFFTMGYIVGRNSSPSGVVQRGPEVATGPPPIQDQKLPSPVGAPVQAPPPATEGAKPAEGAATPTETAPPSTQPAREETAPAPAKSAEVAPASAATSAEPAANQMYLQVASVQQSVAEVVLKTLKEKGFPATLSAGPNGLTRVLVGPYRDTGSIGKAKAELENAGFHPWVRR